MFFSVGIGQDYLRLIQNPNHGQRGQIFDHDSILA